MDIPKYEDLKKVIKDKINEGIWEYGGQIPPQRKLEELFGVSRITVKKATSDLINEGYLEHQSGKKGVFVKPQSKHSGSKTIAVAIDDVTDYFGATLLRGISDYLWENKYYTIVCNADRDFEKVEAYFHSFDFGKVDGVIFSPVIDIDYQKRNTDIVRLLKQKGIPYILVDRFIPGIRSSYVIADDKDSSRLLTNALIKAGHEHILIGMGLECTSMTQRIEGIRQSFSENGLKFNEKQLIQVNDNLLHPEPKPEELDHMKDQIIQAGKFSAFYAQNDRLLNAGVKGMFALGMDINSIQLALHNEVSKSIEPYTNPIPRIIPPIYKMGAKAAKILLNEIIEGDDSVNHVILKNDIFYENLNS